MHLKELFLKGTRYTKHLLSKSKVNAEKLVEMVISLLHQNFDVADKYIIDNTATMILRKCS